MADGSKVGVDLSRTGGAREPSPASRSCRRAPDRIMTVEELELAYVTRVVGLCNGNKALAAQKLGVSRQTLSRWLAEPTAQ